jgi:hypothetical protein
MSIDHRKLPPVEPIEPPRRMSMTLLAKADSCPRSAYLYVKHRGGPGSHQMDRGTLGHAVLERALGELIARGEPRFAPEDPEQAASMMAALVDEVLRERPDLVVPRREVDDVRELAYHWSAAYDVDPEHVAGIERLMVLDLGCGWTVSGRLDVIALPSADIGLVDDYKTGRAMPSQEEYDGSVQPWVYAVLLCFGTPVDVTPCPVCDGGCISDESTFDQDVPCPTCEGKGTVEVRGEPFGQHLKGVWTRELYPSAKPRDDGTLHRREMLLSRTLIADYLADLERMAQTLGERFGTEYAPCTGCGGRGWWRHWEDGGVQDCEECGATGVITNGSLDFPARAGSWCSECPASQECPLPAHLRDHAGAINSVQQAEEAWEKTLVAKQQLAAVEKEVKTFARAHDVPIRVGDLEWRWQPKEGRAVAKAGGRSNWDGLVAAVTESVEYGTPFEIDAWVKPTTGSEFKKSKISTEGER